MDDNNDSNDNNDDDDGQRREVESESSASAFASSRARALFNFALISSDSLFHCSQGSELNGNSLFLDKMGQRGGGRGGAR